MNAPDRLVRFLFFLFFFSCHFFGPYNVTAGKEQLAGKLKIIAGMPWLLF